ncbi:MAG: histidine phosphatase family protein [Clostridia bacterium]|nr:histidine phosphatase family protein [Clostridia bacterium]
MTRVIIIRHGESLANAERIYLGHTDWDLSERGRAQAEAVAEHLGGENIDAIYSSDLKRAYNTALPHARRRGMGIITSRELREIYLGDWECMKIDELEARWPEEFGVGWRLNFGTCRVPGGESTWDAGERLRREVLKIAKENDGKTVLIASHAAAIRAFWGNISGIAPCELGERVPFPKNASCTTVHYDGGKLIPICYGDDSYFE